jgi:hypothetical protein
MSRKTRRQRQLARKKAHSQISKPIQEAESPPEELIKTPETSDTKPVVEETAQSTTFSDKDRIITDIRRFGIFGAIAVVILVILSLLL